MLFSIAATPFNILTNNAQGSQFFHILTNTYYFLFFLNSNHTNGCVLGVLSREGGMTWFVFLKDPPGCYVGNEV